MKVYTQGKWCFIRYSKGVMLCIGRTDEVDKADPIALSQMVIEARAEAEFQEIQKSPKVIH